MAVVCMIAVDRLNVMFMSNNDKFLYFYTVVGWLFLFSQIIIYIVLYIRVVLLFSSSLMQHHTLCYPPPIPQ